MHTAAVAFASEPSSTGAERMLSIAEVIRLTGACRSSIYAWTKAGLFPKGVKIGLRRVAWRASELEAWMRTR